MRNSLYAFLTLCLLASQAHATITQRTINYGISVGQPPYPVDIDLDGDNDFAFVNRYVQQANRVFVNALGNNGWLKDGSNGAPRPFMPGQGLGSSPAYSAPGNDTALGTNFGGIGQRYLMVRFNRGSAVHYGWILLDIGPGGFFGTVISCAWEDVPNTPVLPGQTTSSTSIAGPSGRSSATCCRGSTGIQLAGIQADDEVAINVCDAHGRLILQRNAVSNGPVAVDAPPGLYVVTLVSEKTRERRVFRLQL